MTVSDAELLELFDREVRRKCEWTCETCEEMPKIVRCTHTSAGKEEGVISWSELTTENADAEIEYQMAHYSTLHMGFKWKVYTHDQPTDLGERLLLHGFIPDNPEALLVAGMDDLLPEVWNADVSEVSRVKTPAEVDAIIAMENKVWDCDLAPIAEGLKHDMVASPDLLSIFAVWDGERVVSAAWTLYLQKTPFASLWGGCTVKEYRGRGYYTALLATRAREVRERGYRFMQVEATPKSQPILAKFGFRYLGYATPYVWSPG